MGFDIFAAVMAVLSVLSFGLIGPADVVDEEPEIEIISGATDTKPQAPETETPQSLPDEKETGQNEQESQTKPPAEEQKPSVQPGADLIAGTWSGKSSVPFIASASFRAEVSADGTAQFSGEVTSSVFGDSTFSTPASWEYRGGTSFNTRIEGTDTKVTCDGKTLTFPANPYRLGLVESDMADREFVITLNRA